MAGEKKANGDGSIYRQKDGLWAGALTIGWDENGKQIRKVIRRKDRGKLVAEMRKLKSELAEHGDLIPQSLTLGDWITKWRDEIAPKEVRPKTMEGYRNNIDSYLIPIIGKVKLSKFGTADVRKLHTSMARIPRDKRHRDMKPSEWPESACTILDSEGKHAKHDGDHQVPMLSSTTIRLAHNVLSSALDQALRESPPLIRKNPCSLVSKPKARSAEQKGLELDEAIQLLQYVGTLEDGPMWAWYILTGGRRGEVAGMEVDRAQDDVDFSWQLQRIKDVTNVPDDWEHKHIRSTIYLTRPKSEAGARVFPHVEPLRSFTKLAVGDRTEGFVFTQPNGECIDPDMPSKRWKTVLKDAGLPTDVTLHGSRHTVADLLYLAGVPEDLIPLILGHSSRAMSRKYKTRSKIQMDRLRAAMESMSGLLQLQPAQPKLEPTPELEA